MALDLNGVKLLLWSKNLGASFERTATLGRQGFSCSPGELRPALRDFGFEAGPEQFKRIFKHPPMTSLFAEEFLHFLGAKELQSVDISDFEGATLLHDLNQPFEARHQAAFSFVLDAGTLEHIFHYPQALRHCLELVEVGGHFLTITPTNNQMGHGFYQFSPELFFRVFNAENGFTLRKIVLYDYLKTDAPFYEVLDPSKTGGRTHVFSPRPLYLAVLAERVALKPILNRPPLQSDYVQLWEQSKRQTPEANTGATSRLFRLRRALNPYWPYWLRRWKKALYYARVYGKPNLRNRRHFRRLSRKEVCGERAAALPVEQKLR